MPNIKCKCEILVKMLMYALTPYQSIPHDSIEANGPIL